MLVLLKRRKAAVGFDGRTALSALGGCAEVMTLDRVQTGMSFPLLFFLSSFIVRMQNNILCLRCLDRGYYRLPSRCTLLSCSGQKLSFLAARVWSFMNLSSARSQKTSVGVFRSSRSWCTFTQNCTWARGSKSKYERTERDTKERDSR